jgi:pimeloyl-[acyl-carrier protein] synthase
MSAVPRELDFPLNDIPKLGNDLLARVDALRSVDPIMWSETNQVWMVTGHTEVMEGFGILVPLSSHRLPGAAVAQIPPQDHERLLPLIMNATRNWLLNMDDPEHARLRRLLVRAFSKPIVEGLRPHARGFIKDALDAAGKKGDIEFVSEVARIIPARTILRQLGLSDNLVPRLHHWSQTINQVGNVNVPLADLLVVEQTLKELREVYHPAFAERRRNLGDDFLSALVTANEAGDKLSVDEMCGTCDIVLIAGHDTTTNTMSLGTAALSQHPEACEYIRQHPENGVNIVMELSRLVSMSTAMGRCVAKDFNWCGHEMKKGQIVILFQGSANRDPRVFPNPDTLDFTRSQDQNMMFAPGPHHCIGHLLAKMQLAEFFPELVRRFDIELLDKRLNFGPTMGFRGLDTLNLRLHPRH